MTIAVRLFGQLSLDDGTRALGPRDFGGCKPKQLFEQLLCAQGSPVSKDRLADGLWGERLPQNVEATLETYVSVLRRSLGDRGRELVITEQRAYRVALDLVSLDTLEFDALVERAAEADTRAARTRLEAALALAARGEFLADEPYSDWAAPLRYHYGGKVLAALVSAAEAALSLADASAALAHAESAIARDRFHEPAHRARILALYTLGRQHEALGAYMACRRVLDEELGLEPMPETRALQKAILAQADPSSLVAAPVPPPFPTGPELLLGRGLELDELEDAAWAGRDDGVTLRLVEGEAAIGKPAVLDALSARLENLAEALDVDPLDLVEQLEELCELGLLATDGDGFRVRYPLLRESLRRSLMPGRRRPLHARIPSTVPARLAG